MTVDWPSSPATFRRPVEVFTASDPARLDEIRRFYLDPQETYTVLELAGIWRIHPDDVRAIYHDDLLSWSEEHPEAPDALPIEWIDALGASFSFNIIRPVEVEQALSDDFERVRPASWRTVPFVVHLPRWLVTALENDDAGIPLIPRCASLAMRVERAMFDLFEDDRFEIRPAHRPASRG
jgi:hypothetical protein